MMKRVILFGSLLVSAGFSQELPDFREYLKNKSQKWRDRP